MNLTPHQTLAVAGIAIALLLAAWLLVRLLRSRRKSPEEIERLRRLDIHRRGRITSGQIVDFVDPEPGQSGPYLVVYKYEIGGVDYEVAQDVTALPTAIPLVRRLLGRNASLKYDPKRPTNSIIACEDWSGLPKLQGGGDRDSSAPLAAPEAAKKS